MRPLTFQILRELSDAHFTSGVALAKKLGVSRSAISDALMEASENNVEIFKLTKRGYRLAVPLDFLDIEKIRKHLAKNAGRVDIDIVDTIESTNTELSRRSALANLPSGTCLVTELQTAGRGRRGRQWQSGLATSLTFSLLWRFEKGAAQLGGLSLVVGLALVRALRTIGITQAAVKWPNDILIDHKKLGGILIETQGDMLGPTAAVIGIGVNVALPDAMKQSIDQPATDFSEHTNQVIGRNQLLAQLLGELVPALGKFNTLGFAVYRDEWLACHAYQNCPVHVIQGGGDSFDAIVTGVAMDGSLIVKKTVKKMADKPGQSGLDDAEIALASAEISVRPASVKPAGYKQLARV